MGINVGLLSDVDNSTGWPWYAANLPPTDFYDCLFIYFSCTDFETPGNYDLTRTFLSCCNGNILYQNGLETRANAPISLTTA